MRSDITEKLTERSRRRGGVTYRQVRADRSRIDENSPNRESMRKPYDYDRKELSDFLAPLKRFLKTSIGRPWNDVYSEVCRATKNGSATMSRHVLEHMSWMVELHPTFSEDGIPYAIYKFGGNVSTLYGFYVDLEGRLQYVHRKRWKKPESPNTVFWVDEMQAYRLIDGIWWEVDYKLLSEARGWVVYDVVLKCQLHRKEGHSLHVGTAMGKIPLGTPYTTPERWVTFEGAYGYDASTTKYAYRKRQLNSREIKKAGLLNV